jgi:hypothetical protein
MSLGYVYTTLPMAIFEIRSSAVTPELMAGSFPNFYQRYMYISIIEGNPQTLPQIRIDDVEATCHSHHLSQSAHLIIICRLGTCVRSS